MIECMGDVMSLLCLGSFPALMAIMFFCVTAEKAQDKTHCESRTVLQGVVKIG